jgi:hypothetical protein
MLADDRSEVPLKRYAHAIAAMDPDKTAAVGVGKVNLGVPTGLINPIYPEAGCA